MNRPSLVVAYLGGSHGEILSYRRGCRCDSCRSANTAYYRELRERNRAGFHRRTAPETFWERVNKTSGCWLWLGAPNSYGYGRITVDGREVLAHRFAYQQLVGVIPDGMQLDHLCRVRNCVNPSHLEPVTLKENVLRGNGVAARNARKTECVKGHSFSDEANVRVGPNGSRVCRTCVRIKSSRAVVAS